VPKQRLRPRIVLAGTTLVASVATVWSLWFSLGLGLVPCELCWYQRILMYPLTVVIGVATYENRPAIWRSVLPLSVLGGGLATYHTLLQMASSSCSFGGTCGIVQWQLPVFGFTIPNLSLLAFVAVSLGVIIAHERDRRV
jgi:disulfide bond formation protein DsbB